MSSASALCLSVANWRGLSGPCAGCGRSVLSFDLEDGGVLRLLIGRETRRDLAEVLVACGEPVQLRCGDCAQPMQGDAA